MKKLLLALSLASLTVVSCGESKEKKEDKSGNENTTFSAKKNTTILKWTAFKTTEKLPVGGEFTKVELTEVPSSDKKHLAIEGLGFSIPVSSVYTNNESRDTKIKNLFFGVMDNTELISGAFKNIEGNDKEGHGVVSIKMNSVKCDVPFDYTIDGNEFKIKSTANILSWKAQNALDSLNKACYNLHKGADGISKTWEDVEINASVELEEK